MLGGSLTPDTTGQSTLQAGIHPKMSLEKQNPECRSRVLVLKDWPVATPPISPCSLTQFQITMPTLPSMTSLHNRALFSFLDNYDVVFIVVGLDALNKQKEVATARQAGNLALVEYLEWHDLVLTLRTTCR